MGPPILDSVLIPCQVPRESLSVIPLKAFGYKRDPKCALYVPLPKYTANNNEIQPDNNGSSSNVNTAAVAVETIQDWIMSHKSFSAISMGNPHVVVRMQEYDIEETNGDASQEDKYNFEQENLLWDVFRRDIFPILGPWLSTHPYFPKGANVEFVRVITRRSSDNALSDLILDTLVWERGCGPTSCCGTGACAVTVASKFCAEEDWSSTKPVEVRLPGGSLFIEFALNQLSPLAAEAADLGDDEATGDDAQDLKDCFDPATGRVKPTGLPSVMMTGPATKVYNGTITISL